MNIKEWNNKASDIKLVYFYSTTIFFLNFSPNLYKTKYLLCLYITLELL